MRLSVPSGKVGAMHKDFDAEYYRRHYEDPKTAVADPESAERLGRFVCSYLDYLGVDVELALDLGCGVGLWRDVIERELPDARYVGVEVSAYLCKRFGWKRGSVVDFEHEPADFVICQGVLQYIEDDRLAARAMRNLARLTGTALYLEALTEGDWQHVVDRRITDGAVRLRPVEWYRSRLRKDFVDVGGGVFLKRSARVPCFELEGRAP